MKETNQGFGAGEFGGNEDAQKAAEELHNRAQDTKEDMAEAAQKMAADAPQNADDILNDNRFNSAYRTKQKIKDKKANAKEAAAEAEKAGPLKIDFDKYQDFVDKTTSGPSKDFEELIKRYQELHKQGCNIERLDTAASGLVAEAGEFMEIVKKLKFQGKPYDEANKEHLTKELGDIMWYVAQACLALDVRLDEVLYINTLKLAARYPEGMFDINYSENRAPGDI